MSRKELEKEEQKKKTRRDKKIIEKRGQKPSSNTNGKLGH